MFSVNAGHDDYNPVYAHGNYFRRKKAVKKLILATNLNSRFFICFGRTPIAQCRGCEMIDRFD